MPNSIPAVAPVAHEDNEAVHLFTYALRFTVEDTPLPGGNRWDLVGPRSADAPGHEVGSGYL